MNAQLLSRTIFYSVRNFHGTPTVKTSKPSPLIDSIIRVDHAGELGADRIYAGQMAVLGNSKIGPVIQHMWDQEKVHKAAFEELIVKHRVRPTALIPIWNVAGYLLGAGTALLGEKAAMACTVAVESVIVNHYNDQLRQLMEDPEVNKELLETIKKFRDDEQEHHDHGIGHGAEQAPFYKALTEAIKFGCKTAIAISKDLLSHKSHGNLIISRNYSTGANPQSKLKWDLYSAVCLERKPVILKPFNELERKVSKTLLDIENEYSWKSDHEIKDEEDIKKSNLIKKGLENIDLDSNLIQTAHEFEEASNKEFESFRVASRTTLADVNNDLKSLNRKLDSHLLLLINEKHGNKKQWMLPQGIRKESENMRETAERIVEEKFGKSLNVFFLGNAPCGFYKYKYPDYLRTGSLGVKVFFFKAIYLSGQIENKSDEDFVWATRPELPKLLKNDKYYKKVSLFLIDDEDDEREVVD